MLMLGEVGMKSSEQEEPLAIAKFIILLEGWYQFWSLLILRPGISIAHSHHARIQVSFPCLAFQGQLIANSLSDGVSYQQIGCWCPYRSLTKGTRTVSFGPYQEEFKRIILLLLLAEPGSANPSHFSPASLPACQND